MIEDAEWSEMPIRTKLEHYIQTTSVSQDGVRDCRERYDFWSDILGVAYGGYAQNLDEDVMRVMERMQGGDFFAESAYEELISYILCGADLAEYGTSPRGAWINHEIKDLVPATISRWRRDWEDSESHNATPEQPETAPMAQSPTETEDNGA